MKNIDAVISVVAVICVVLLMLVVGISASETAKKDMHIEYLEAELVREAGIAEENRALILQLIDMQRAQNEMLLGR